MSINNNGLIRFREAQDPVYSQVISELKDGQKKSHWMWFVFPQLKGLSPNPSHYSKKYALNSAEEALQYYKDASLGKRLLECTKLIFEAKNNSIDEIMGSSIDAQKLLSSMTLFYRTSDNDLFKSVVEKYFEGEFDQRTEELLNSV